VDALVAEARGEMTDATADAASVQQVSSRVLIAVVLLSLLSSGLIVVIVKVAPAPGALSTVTSPPSSRQYRRVMASPSPVPP
jgi:hypothetical protein